MHKFKAAALVGLLCLWAVVGCTTNTNPGKVNFTTVATLQLAVGEINDTAGILESLEDTGPPAGAQTFLNAIMTFRNQNGNSAYLKPGQAQLTPGTGSCNFVTGAGCNAGGQFTGGLFAYGQNPGFNGTTAAAPAWAAPGSSTGYMVDLNTFTLPAIGAPGTAYAIKDQLVVNSSTLTYTAGATLNNPITTLGTSGPGSYAAIAGTGGGTYTFGACPAGATEQVAVFLSGAPGSNPGISSPFVVAMAEAVCPATTAVIPPGTVVPPSLPFALTCFVVAADFPWVEAGQKTSPAVAPPNPVIVGANGNADLSASGSTTCTQT